MSNLIERPPGFYGMPIMGKKFPPATDFIDALHEFAKSKSRESGVRINEILLGNPEGLLETLTFYRGQSDKLRELRELLRTP